MFPPAITPEEFFARVKVRLAQPLPGEAAQNRMTSRARISTQEYLERNPGYRHSAVLLPLFPHEGEIYTALIRRPTYDGLHSGQLALPGGKREESDRTLTETALRETMEEVGVGVSPEAVIGRLSQVYIPPSNFLVQPFVAQLDARPSWQRHPHEVDEVLEIPIRELFDPVAKDRRRIPVGKNAFVEAPCYLVHGQVLWGATAMMFSELEAVLESI